MTLEQIKNKPVIVRVIQNTTDIDIEEMNEMIGGEFFQRTEFRNDEGKIIERSLRKKNKSYSLSFNEQDLQVLTNVEFNGVRIGIGDEINSGQSFGIVYGEFFYNGGWRLLYVTNNNFSLDCHFVPQKSITAHRPLHPKKEIEIIEVTIEEIAKLKGVDIKNLRIKE